METQAIRVKLKQGALPRVRAWMAEMAGRRDEVIATMRDEAVIHECYFLDHAQDGDYLVGVFTAENCERARQVFAASVHRIDAEHKQFQADAYGTVQRLELLAAIDRFDDQL
jgi:hypothetical protein